jgi:short subunit dehydrogenase-like uncharacterized protein
VLQIVHSTEMCARVASKTRLPYVPRMSWLLYGANGYTGELVAELAKERGDKPILAGRNEAAVRAVAERLGFAWRAFSLDDPAAVDRGLDGVSTVQHCAGPFSRTSQPMVEACLRKKVHYLDITGEIPVFEACAARDAEAKKAGVMLMPGTGFDVVPTDCLAAHLKKRLPTATRLALGFQALSRTSRGTATTMVENIDKGGMVRRGGTLTPVPQGYRTRTIDFGRGPRKAVTFPWGDVSTAWYSTKIPDIEVYVAVPGALRVGMKVMPLIAPVLASSPVQKFLKARLQAGSPGPNAEERARGKSLVWGEAEDDAGGHVVSRLNTPEGYSLTAESALAIARRVDAGGAKPGFQTPSLAFGPDFVLELGGVTRTDE